MPHNSPRDHKHPRKHSGPPRAAAPAKPLRRAKATLPKAEVHEQHTTERIAKVMARAGSCSRRDAETWIEEGRVAVNGKVLLDPAFNVGEDDVITIDGTPLPRRARTRLFRFHKPRGLVSTERDPEGRPTIFDHLREHWPDGPRVVSVGRLDINTEGLMLLTNDGGLARVLELPSTGWVRRYRVRANGETDQAALDSLRRGVTIEGVSYVGIEATLDRVQGANCWLTMSLREGKNREVKRVLEHLGLQVNRLIRLSFGPFQLGELAEGSVEEVRTKVLRDQLGPSLAKAAGADFTSPSGEEERASPPAETASSEPEHGRGQNRRPSDRPQPRPIVREPRSRAPEPPATPKQKPLSRTRKHVSVLRRQEAEVQDGPRRRIERGETADRSGRVVSVERVVTVAPKQAEVKPKTSAKTRNARHFDALRKGHDDAPVRKSRGTKSGRSRAELDSQDSRHKSFPERQAARPGVGKTPARRAETGEPPKGTTRSHARNRSKMPIGAKTRPDGARHETRGQRKPAGQRPLGEGHSKGRNRPGRPPRKA